MFLITKDGVREQDGEASYFLLPEDIDFLATNNRSRVALLQALNEESVIASTVMDFGVKEINLDKVLECGSGIHSKL